MKKEKIYLILTIIFIILTFLGAAFVLFNKGQINAGYAVIPMIFTLVFSSLYRNEKSKKEDENK